MALLFSIMLTGFHTYAYKNDNNLKVFTIRILATMDSFFVAVVDCGTLNAPANYQVSHTAQAAIG